MLSSEKRGAAPRPVAREGLSCRWREANPLAMVKSAGAASQESSAGGGDCDRVARERPGPLPRVVDSDVAIAAGGAAAAVAALGCRLGVMWPVAPPRFPPPPPPFVLPNEIEFMRMERETGETSAPVVVVVVVVPDDRFERARCGCVVWWFVVVVSLRVGRAETSSWRRRRLCCVCCEVSESERVAAVEGECAAAAAAAAAAALAGATVLVVDATVTVEGCAALPKARCAAAPSGSGVAAADSPAEATAWPRPPISTLSSIERSTRLIVDGVKPGEAADGAAHRDNSGAPPRSPSAAASHASSLSVLLRDAPRLGAALRWERWYVRSCSSGASCGHPSEVRR